jgi:hypothetical protein
MSRGVAHVLSGFALGALFCFAAHCGDTDGFTFTTAPAPEAAAVEADAGLCGVDAGDDDASCR